MSLIQLNNEIKKLSENEILNNKKRLSKVYNKNDTEQLIKNFPDYKLFVFNMNEKNKLPIKKIEELNNILDKNTTTNLNFVLISRVDHELCNINIWVTPIVESA